ncbi:hypothetical protein GGTG_11429 [Gaeumannomyces tritici R3-111a-1]|uniref:Uncharacterized protein n=1 Tax=Gaeumannomyces tritici (strain R3-111a-1) TaxID=644352 RepID=J3PD60_GAET3|nr:hypothetical protein GGTG_11429 [Gaeumannomyces tritici R3-111a-1]EJT70405.1 hypothetical protein GGTG_11429 [Gaeumannomyces tritici R3-111a-1]
MATAVLLALGSTAARGDGLITANSTLDAAKQTLNTTANLTMESRIAMTTDGIMARTFATSSRRPITTKLTTVYGTKVVVVSTTGSPISTYTLTGPTPGPPKNGPLRGINKCEMVDHGVGALPQERQKKREKKRRFHRTANT